MDLEEGVEVDLEEGVEEGLGAEEVVVGLEEVRSV